MANSNVAKGLTPVKHINGSPWNGQTHMYLIPSSDGTATFVGDLVKLAGSAGAAGTVVAGQDVEGMPTIAQSAAGNTHVGVVVGFLPDPTNLSKLYRAASENRIALVVDDPTVVFEAQEDSVGGALAAANVGNNVEVIVGSGSTTTGVSAAQLDSSTAATTNTLSLRILRLAKHPDNSIGTNAKYEVMINLHQFLSTTGV